MTGPNFMVADLAATLAAVCLFPLFVFIPGYVAASLGNLFDFRRRTLVFRAALSVPLSIALCPILIYLAGRFFSMQAVWILYAACWVAFVPLVVRDVRHGTLRLNIPREWWIFGAIAGGWLVLALFSSIDLQIGNRAYFPTIAFDYAVRTQFIHSIGAGKLPPSNPFFFPGHTVPLRYHYFWLLLCSLVDQAGGSVVGPRRAWMGGTIWCGFGFLAVIALYFRLFVYRGVANLRRRILIAVSLACITGLDIIPTGLLWILRATGMKNAVFPSVEFWNEQVDGFVWTSLWTAHHMAALIACLMAFLLLTEAIRKIEYAPLAGIAMATAVGSSIYVSFAFAVFLAAWGVLALRRRWWREIVVLAVAGAAGFALFLPYVLDLRGPGPTTGFPIQIWVRPLHPADFAFQAMHLGRQLRGLLNGLLLPLNYFLELGFFFAAGVVWWRRRRANPEPLSRAELALAVMAATSVAVCTFLRSAVIANNDLGWRGFLIAQFALLLWAVDVLADRMRPRRAILTVLLVLGAAGTTYDVLILRLFPVLADHGIVAKTPWMAGDPDLGRRNFASREAYEWTNAAAPSGTVIQFNPRVVFQDHSALLYSTHPFAAANQTCMSAFGGDPAQCTGMVAQLNQLYAGKDSLAEVCQDLPIDVIVAKDTDPAWSNRSGWVWSNKPLYSNTYYRVFGCGLPNRSALDAPR